MLASPPFLHARKDEQFLILHGQPNNNLLGNNSLRFFQSRFNKKIRAGSTLHGGDTVNGIPYRKRNPHINAGT